MTAITGASTFVTVIVPSLSISDVKSRQIAAPALESAHLGAPGMVGIDALQGHAVSIDFDRREMTVRPMSKRSHEKRSEEHTSELQSLMRSSYAVFCLKKKTQ